MIPARMKTIDRRMGAAIGAAIAFAFIMAIPFGCNSSSQADGDAQKTFATSEQAVNEFVDALRQDDENAMRTILGPEADELLTSGDPVDDRNIRQQFVTAYDRRHTFEQQGDALILVVGDNEWPFPIPLVKQDDTWIFDTAEGKEEILDRRIGRNELDTIQVMEAIVDAQREYARRDYDGDGLTEYARQFRSDSGQKNGLYWPTGPNEDPSPLGSLVAQAKQERYFENGMSEAPRPYHGYYYKMLTAQGPNAPGGQYDYIVKGKMIGGFAVLAYPAQYGNSGVMTFIVNHDGRVYQKDLGKNTEELAPEMQSFNPDRSWTPVPQQEAVGISVPQA